MFPMKLEIPIEYVSQKFIEYAGYANYNKMNGSYKASCPTCKEGSSWKRKKRLHYIPEKGIIHCFNCTKTWNPVNWIMEQTGMTFKEVMKDIEDSNYVPLIKQKVESEITKLPDLPDDSINLFDKQQTDYYLKNNNVYVKTALECIQERRLDTAVNRPRALYLSLTDPVHKNRLIIPFYDELGKVLWYQSRTLLEKDKEYKPKYLSKANSEKSIFGIDNIDPNLDYIFITEGPIDSMFIRNGIAIGSLTMATLQKRQLSKYIFHKLVWIFDNEMDTNEQVKLNMKKHLKEGDLVFIWPDKFKDFKDINQLCMHVKKNEISTDFFIKNSVSKDMLKKSN